MKFLFYQKCCIPARDYTSCDDFEGCYSGTCLKYEIAIHILITYLKCIYGIKVGYCFFLFVFCGVFFVLFLFFVFVFMLLSNYCSKQGQLDEGIIVYFFNDKKNHINYAGQENNWYLHVYMLVVICRKLRMFCISS